jgi:hypothetical protein
MKKLTNFEAGQVFTPASFEYQTACEIFGQPIVDACLKEKAREVLIYDETGVVVAINPVTKKITIEAAG